MADKSLPTSDAARAETVDFAELQTAQPMTISVGDESADMSPPKIEEPRFDLETDGQHVRVNGVLPLSDVAQSGPKASGLHSYRKFKQSSTLLDRTQEVINKAEDLSDGSFDEDVHIDPPRVRNQRSRLAVRSAKANKRVEQFASFGILVEGRLRAMENLWKEYQDRVDPEPLVEPMKRSKDNDSSQSMLNAQLWAQFVPSAGKASSGYAIDVLVTEPAPIRPLRATNRLTREPPPISEALVSAGGRGAAEHAPFENDAQQEAQRIRGISMPARICINSYPLRHLIFKTISHSPQWVTNVGRSEVPPPVILRPNKVLLHRRAYLTEAYAALRNARERRQIQDNSNTSTHILSKRSATECVHLNRQRLANDFDGKQYDALSEATERYYGCFCERCSNQGVDDLKMLLDFIATYLTPVAAPIRERSTQEVQFHDMWVMFQPGDIITSKRVTFLKDGSRWHPIAFRILQTRSGREQLYGDEPALLSNVSYMNPDKAPLPAVDGINPFIIDAFYIDTNGQNPIPVSQRCVIYPYKGYQKVTDLSVFPIEYAAHDRYTNVWALQDRGRKFANLVSLKQMQCRSHDLKTHEFVEGPIVVDTQEYYNLYTARRPQFASPYSSDISETNDCSAGRTCRRPQCVHQTFNIHQDQIIDKQMTDEVMSTYAVLRSQTMPIENQPEGWLLSEEDYAICQYAIPIFLLRSRKWVSVHINEITEVERVSAAKGFDLLELPDNHKHMLRSQVEEHFRKAGGASQPSQEGMDIVRGKGKGLIILLHGAPGMGKTSTAECIADLMEKPLFPITSGDFGTTPEDVERNLADSFSRASRWGCVLLLDEADVFLTRRERYDYHRNAIVSVFLRMLEYYTGILFLTTNRVGTLDEACKSRIHVALHYPPFDEATTLKVWQTAIDRARTSMKKDGMLPDIKEKKIMEFAQKHFRQRQENENIRWNGRQIRNAFQTAIAMASYDARRAAVKAKSTTSHGDGEPEKLVVKLGPAQFKIIAETMKQFDDYLVETMGETYEEYGEGQNLRRQVLTPESDSVFIRKKKSKPSRAVEAKGKRPKKSKKTKDSSEEDSDDAAKKRDESSSSSSSSSDSN